MKLTVSGWALMRRDSLAGLGGALFGFGVDAPDTLPLLIDSTAVESIEFRRLWERRVELSSVPPPSEGEGNPMRMRASRLESWFGFSRLYDFWVAARCVGEGGLGAGFMACATVSGMVGMLQDETTAPADTPP